VTPRLAPSSPANARVRGWLALRDRAERERTGQTLIDGAREIDRAIDGGVVLRELVVGPDDSLSEGGRSVAARVAETGVPIVPVSVRIIERLAFGDRRDGVVAVARIPAQGLDRLPTRGGLLVVVLEAVEKPGNLGAVLRATDGAGADAVVLADPVTDAFNPNAVRASLGTVFSVPLAIASATEALAWCRTQGLRVVAARVDGERAWDRVDLRGGVALAFGSEAHGLSATWSAAEVETVRLPMLGVGDSLNVAATAAVLLYEARRQRGIPGEET